MKIKYLIIVAMINVITFALGAKTVYISASYDLKDPKGVIHYALRNVTFKAQHTDTLGDITQQMQGQYNEKYPQQPGQVKNIAIFDPYNNTFVTVDQLNPNQKISNYLYSNDQARLFAMVYLY